MPAILSELKIIRNALLRVVGAFVLLTLGFLAASIPYLHGTVSEAAIEAIRVRLLPAGATLAVMSPLDPFLTQATVAASLAFAVCIPLIFFELWHFAAPGLERHERRALAGGLISALVFAGAGAAFAYFLLIPLMFGELYAFLPHDVVPLFSLREVISLVMGFALGTALMFLLPLGMVLLSSIGLVPPRVWGTYARHAVLLVLVVSAIITPDGSGVGMVLLAVPVCGLYGAGYAASAGLSQRKVRASLTTNQ